ncbi:hypothetical protein GHT06_009056 [Daphnia sinensis]|uniref:Zinc finger protein n=1 Tax=Daphnia sinensis TaxID=1820382 RepID=A0AAD5LM75_9CRUS|nr:hypothetical protein GHT06_009056 [Daphnia sinensis]
MGMASKRKKTSSSEGPVKIVGINHGVCLHHFLLMDGWKKEQFTDVTFFCQSPDDNNEQHNLQNKLRANRSVLAAASRFFSTLLPDCELELDVCISIDLSFEELFCVLEYIYSGKLLCSVKSKDRILSILREFDIFVPDHLQNSVYCGRNGSSETEVEIIFEEAIASEPKTIKDSTNILQDTSSFGTSADVRVLNSGELILRESNISSSNEDLFQNEEKLQEKFANSHKMYSNKSKTHCGSKITNVSESIVESESRHFKDPLLPAVSNQPTSLEEMPESVVSSEIGAVEPNSNPSLSSSDVDRSNVEDEWTIRQIPDRQTVTLQFPAQILGSTNTHPNELEHTLIKRTTVPYNTSTYPLPLYHSHTWCYGIYTPVDPAMISQETALYDHSLPTNKGQQFVHDWTSFKQPTFLVSRPQRVYNRRELVARERPNQNKAVLKLTDIQNMKAYKGKIHVTLNGKPIVQPTLPQLFHGGGDYENGEPTESNNQQQQCMVRRSTSVASIPESEDDKIDLALAKHFLQEEVRLKQKLQMRLKMFSDRLTQHKEIARSILKRTKELEQRKRENETTKLYPTAKKSGPQTQCEQCGKMVLASRLAIHLKIHSGIKSHLCELCGRAFLLKAYLNAHIRINHRGTERPKRFMCSSCGYTCDQKHKLEVHERVHTDERPFTCTYCDKKFREKGTLVRHIRTHTGEKPYSCNICGTSYAARDTYVQHYRRKHEQQRSDNTNEPRSRTRHSSVVIYRCEFCQKGFYRILAYEKHRATHTGVAAAVRCTQGDCDFTYSDMTQLKDHMAICHPGKTYTCAVCSKVFLTKQNLANHQSKHDPTLGFHCSYCSMSLTTKASLIAHEKIHTRDKPYECSYCGMCFHSPYLIKIHLRKHQPSQPKRKRSRRSIEEVSENPDTDVAGDTVSIAYY